MRVSSVACVSWEVKKRKEKKGEEENEAGDRPPALLHHLPGKAQVTQRFQGPGCGNRQKRQRGAEAVKPAGARDRRRCARRILAGLPSHDMSSVASAIALGKNVSATHTHTHTQRKRERSEILWSAAESRILFVSSVRIEKGHEKKHRILVPFP